MLLTLLRLCRKMDDDNSQFIVAHRDSRLAACFLLEPDGVCIHHDLVSKSKGSPSHYKLDDHVFANVLIKLLRTNDSFRSSFRRSHGQLIEFDLEPSKLPLDYRS